MKASLIAIALVAVLSAGNALADDDRARAHTLSLPPLRPTPAMRWWSEPDAVIGEVPSAVHPHGTVLVLEAASGQPAPTIAEWDLATGRKLRNATLPLGPELSEARILKTGDRIHIVACELPRHELLYVRLSAAFQVEARENLGSVDRMSAATDGSIVAILWSGIREGGGMTRGWQVVTLDSTGTWLGTNILSKAEGFADGTPLVVLERKVYALLNDGRALPPIVRLGADARLEESQSVTETPDATASLLAWRGKLGFVDGCWFKTVRTDWLVVSGPQPGVPYRPDRFPWCPYFHAASDDTGRLVTSKGDVVSPSLQIERHVVDDSERTIVPLWIGASPAFLVIGAKTGSLSLVWADPRRGT